MSNQKLIERIERQAGILGLTSALVDLTPTDLQSLLLEVYRQRAKRRSPAEVLADFEENRFVKPSPVSPTRLLEWERVAFSVLPPSFEPVALSPVCPLGTNSVVAPVDQNWAVSTVRNTEVVSDATNVLALEGALRRRGLLRKNSKSTEPVHLMTSHRLLRPQHYDNPELASHFSLLALCSAGRSRGGLHFELEALALHIRFYLRALRTFLGPDMPLHLLIGNFGPRERRSLLEEQLFVPVKRAFEGVECGFERDRTSGRGYYQDLCFRILATTPSGQPLQLVDGGLVNWTQTLLSNAKERLVVSGIGSERVCSEFGG